MDAKRKVVTGSVFIIAGAALFIWTPADSFFFGGAVAGLLVGCGLQQLRGNK